MDERINTSILGIPESQVDFPNSGQRFLPYYSWLKDPGVVPLRFEYFILELDKTLNFIIDNLIKIGIDFNASRDELISGMQAGMGLRTSYTFRKRNTGDWKVHFNESLRKLFKQVAGELLIDLGYEEDFNW